MNRGAQNVIKSVEIDGEVFEFSIRKSKKAKNLLLHVEPDGAINVVLPWRVPYRLAEKFVDDRKEWIKKSLDNSKKLQDDLPKYRFATGDYFPVLEKNYELVVRYEGGRTRSSFKANKGVLEVFIGEGHKVRDVVTRWYKKVALQYFNEKVVEYSDRLGVAVNSIVISSAKTQWGSCMKSRGRISLQWRLMLGPKEVADYVIAHEVAHMVQGSHSKGFWQIVGGLDPNYVNNRKWLKKNGHKLVI